jgi:hypothetical protein
MVSDSNSVITKIRWPLETYLIINFEIVEINRDTRKLIRTPHMNQKKIIIDQLVFIF